MESEHSKWITGAHKNALAKQSMKGIGRHLRSALWAYVRILFTRNLEKRKELLEDVDTEVDAVADLIERYWEAGK